MTPKQYLQQISRLDSMINSKLEQIDHLRSLATKVTASIKPTGVSGGSGNTRGMDDCVSKIVDLEREITADIDRLIDLKREIRDSINDIQDNDYRLILELRYLCGRSWESIAEEMGYTSRNANRVHKKALQAFKLS